MDLHEAHVSLEMLDFAGLSRFVSDLLSPAGSVSPSVSILSSSIKARIGKKLKKSLHRALNEEPDVVQFLLGRSAGGSGVNSAAGGSAVGSAVDPSARAGKGLQTVLVSRSPIPSESPRGSEDIGPSSSIAAQAGSCSTELGGVVGSDVDHLSTSVLERFDVWVPIINFALDWPRGWAQLSRVSKKFRTLANAPVCWEGHHIQLSLRDIVGIWPPLCHLSHVWARCVNLASLRLPDGLSVDIEEALLYGFQGRAVFGRGGGPSQGPSVGPSSSNMALAGGLCFPADSLLGGPPRVGGGGPDAQSPSGSGERRGANSNGIIAARGGSGGHVDHAGSSKEAEAPPIVLTLDEDVLRVRFFEELARRSGARSGGTYRSSAEKRRRANSGVVYLEDDDSEENVGQCLFLSARKTCVYSENVPCENFLCLFPFLVTCGVFAMYFRCFTTVRPVSTYSAAVARIPIWGRWM